MPSAASRGYKNSRVGLPSPQTSIESAPACLGFNAFLNERGNHVRGLGVKVVARTVQVHGEQKDRVEPILLAVRLALDQQHLFGEPGTGRWSPRDSRPTARLRERGRACISGTHIRCQWRQIFQPPRATTRASVGCPSANCRKRNPPDAFDSAPMPPTRAAA